MTNTISLIENVLKTMEAKEVRTVIMLCNDRLDEMGHDKFVPATQTQQSPPVRGRRKPVVMKRLPVGECFSGMKSFKDLSTDWVNLKDMQDGEFAVASVGFDTKVYAIVTKKSGEKRELNGVQLHDMAVIRTNKVLADL